ncbi:MAG: PRC-barrel domain-containing protein [Anaerolineales bacterium]
MEIPLNAQVECTDGVFGRSVFVLINPVFDELTHLVVKENASSSEYIVPLEFVSDSSDDKVTLRCSKAQLRMMDPFINKEYIENKVPYTDSRVSNMAYGMGTFYWPYVTASRKVEVQVEQRAIPPEELAIRRGTRIEATDGYIGKVDEFLVDQEKCHITHLVLREGHLWGQKEVVIPISALKDTREDTVFLNLSKHQVESLPSFPLRRRWD